MVSDELKKEGDEENFWSEYSYIKPIDINDLEFAEKRKYIEDDPNALRNYECKNCKKSIGEHNLYWHERMCDNCFFDKYFPDTKNGN